MFYLGEIAALLICWIFYCEFYWKVERKVLKTCSRQYIDKRCGTFADRLFFTPVSGKARLGILYYLNRTLIYALGMLTVVHLAFGWAENLQGIIRIFTTLFVTVLGVFAAFKSFKSTEYICANLSITSKRNILLLKIASLISVIILMLVYLYFAWVYLD